MIHPGADGGVQEALTQMITRVGATPYIRQNEAVIARDDLSPILPCISAPTMVVVGVNDLRTPVILSREISDGISGATLHIIPDCGHLPPIEKPDALAALMRRWIYGA